MTATTRTNTLKTAAKQQAPKPFVYTREQKAAIDQAMGTGKRSKYNNNLTTVDGIKFDSLAEANRYGELKNLEKAGAISGLVATKSALRFPLIVNGVEVGTYEADFIYTDTATGLKVTEDTKGVRTPAYVMKARLMLALHGITVREVEV